MPRTKESADGATPGASAPGLPPPLPTLDTEALRRRLAGLADPDATVAAGTPHSLSTKATIKEHASLLCLVLAQLFNRDALAPETLWERIASGLSAGCEKTQDDDLDGFVTLCLEHVKADVAKAAAHDGLRGLLEVFGTWTPELRLAFLRHVESHKYAVVVHGRSRWEDHKATNGKGGAGR